jgi:alpha/beta superfamily hydrolase
MSSRKHCCLLVPAKRCRASSLGPRACTPQYAVAARRCQLRAGRPGTSGELRGPRRDLPEKQPACGVLVVVGGPQYRVGSHRQFLLLSRRLASEGYPVMRFDYRGMGDGGGAMRSFEDVSADIGAAIEAFQRRCPSVRRIVLWGLCDAASAALLYVEAVR